MPRIFLPIISITNNRISITGENARYLTSVLRCRKGDEVTVFDGGANCFKTTVLKIGRREVVVEVGGRLPCNAESPVRIMLAQALLKGERMDLVVQKTTELGVTEILPVITSRSQLRQTRKSGRWRKIAEEASRQSGRRAVPVIHEPADFINIFSDRASLFSAGLIFYEDDGMKLSEAAQALKRAAGHSGAFPAETGLLVVIGPEGGFAADELALAKDNGLLVVSLGKRILRAETAAISAVALVQFLLGDMG